MVFKRIRDSPFAAAPTWAFGMTVSYVIQDHPVYIPYGQRWSLRPEGRATRAWPLPILRTGGSLSAGIRQHPPMTDAVATEFVTQTWRCSCVAARRVISWHVDRSLALALVQPGRAEGYWLPQRAAFVRSMRAEPPDVTELMVGEPDGVEAGADAIAAYPRELFGHRVPARIDP